MSYFDKRSDLFPFSYEDYIYDAKVEIYDRIYFSQKNYTNNSTIVKVDSSNITELNILLDIKYLLAYKINLLTNKLEIKRPVLNKN